MKKKSITIHPEILGGTPVFTGTRVSVQTLFDYVEGGQTIDEFLKSFPTVKKSQVIDVLHTAEQLITEHENIA
jgi:uncharacterized protein (DUF433 family)